VLVTLCARLLSPAASVETMTIGPCVLEAQLAREVAMNTPVIAVIIVVALIVGSALSIMNKACKRGYHSWCAPMSTVHHHIRIQPPA
jgi:hypothetical protein